MLPLHLYVCTSVHLWIDQCRWMARHTCVGLWPRRWQMDWSRLPLAASDPGSCCLATFVCFHLQDQSNWPAFQLPASDTPPLANGITQWTPGVNKRQDGWMNKCPLSFIDRRVLSSACRGSLFVLVCVCVFVTHQDVL